MVAGSCEYGNESFGSLKGKAFFDYLRDYWLLKKGSFLWS